MGEPDHLARLDSHPDLPLDSDTDVEEGPGGLPRPIHLRWRYVGLVFLGGAAGTAARESLSLVVPTIGDVPVATAGINILGAFLLGVLLEAVVRRGRDEGGRRTLRLLLGTGFLGGFTTYSALATDTVQLAGSGDLALAFAYSLGTLLVGAAATWAGIAVAAIAHDRRGNG